MEVNSRNYHYLLLAIITLAGFALRQAYLIDHDAWWDEICTATRSLLPLADLWTSLKFQGPSPVSADSSPPLSHIIIHFSLLLGQTGYFLKLPNAIFGTLTIPAIYLLGRRLVSPRVGLLAALFVALSAFHVSYSRDARWYALFYFAAIFSFYFFLGALRENKFGQWVGLAVSCTVMLYSSYMATVFLAAYVLLCLLWLLLPTDTDKSYKKTVFVRFLVCAAVVILLYSPWIMGQINAYFFLFSDAPRPPFTVSGFLNLLKATVSPTYFAEFDTKPMVAAILVSGMAFFLASRRYFEFSALCLWALLPLIAAYNVKTANVISPKYLLFMLFVVAYFGAVTADGVAGLLLLKVSRHRDGFRLVIGLALVLGLSTLSLRFYPGHLVEGIHNDKPAVSWAAREKYNAEYLLFERSRQHKAIMDWYIPKMYKQLDEFSDLDYKRCMLAYSAFSKDYDVDKDMVIGDFAFSRIGILNKSPLLIDPDDSGAYVYQDDFHDFQAYSDASRIQNVCVSTGSRTMELYDLNKPGSISYTFANPSQRLLKKVSVQAQVVLDRGNFIEPDCRLMLSVTTPDGSKRLLRSLDLNSFPVQGGTIDISASLEKDLSGSDLLELTFEFSRGVKAGILGVKRFTVFVEQGEAPKQTLDTTAVYARNIAGHTRLTPWDKTVWPLNPPGPYCFDLNQAEGGRALREFKSRFPQAQPVYSLRNSSGEERVLYFDPWLEDPFLRLGGLPAKTVADSAPYPQPGYILRGSLDFPIVHSRDRSWPVTVKTPPGTEFMCVPGGQGRITLRPVFSNQGFSPAWIERYDGIKKLKDEDCLTCIGSNACRLVYGFQSFYPIQDIRVVWYPRLHSDVARQNRVDLSVALDSGKPRLLDSYRSRDTDSWEGPDRKVTTLKFEKPANRVEVIFDLQNDATQIWSANNTVMTIEAKVDTTAAPVLNFFSQDAVWIEGGRMNDFGVYFPREKIVSHDNLEFSH